MSHDGQDLLYEVSQTKLDDDENSNRVEQWVERSLSDCDQPPLDGDTAAGVETHAGVTVNANQPQLPSARS